MVDAAGGYKARGWLSRLCCRQLTYHRVTDRAVDFVVAFVD